MHLQEPRAEKGARKLFRSQEQPRTKWIVRDPRRKPWAEENPRNTKEKVAMWVINEVGKEPNQMNSE